MTALVTGATGFVGSAVARSLLASGRTVRVFARPGSDRRNLDGLDVEVAEGDLTEPDSVRRAVQGAAEVYHVAADYRLWVPEPAMMDRINVEGTEALLQAAAEAGVARFVYTSSVAALGVPAKGEIGDEETRIEAEDVVGVYKRSKYRAQKLVERFAAESGFPVIIVNPSTPIGPRDIKPTPTGRIIVEAASGRIPAFVDTGLNLVHVEDVAEGHLLAAENGRSGESYILGGENWSLADMLREIASMTGRRPPRVSLPHGAVLPVAYLAESWSRLTGKEPFVTRDAVKMSKARMFYRSDKAQRELGYRARRAVEGLRDAIRWFRANNYL